MSNWTPQSRFVVGCLVPALVALSTGCVADASGQDVPHRGAPLVSVPSGAGALDRLPDIVERTLPGVVGISTKRTVQQQAHPFFGRQLQPSQRQLEGMGSGVIVDKTGLIVTNNHVIAGADEIVVQLHDGTKLDAKLVGTDPRTDIAVVKLTEKRRGLQPIPFGDSEALRLGEPVIAIGNPFGLSSTVTLGIVSAKGRENVGILDYEDFIQTDAAINPGNSGGALVNTHGELVGINTAILSRSGGYQGIGFAIPTEMVASIKDSIIKDGKVTRGWLGVSIQTVDAEISRMLKLPSGTRGVAVAGVQPDSPAHKAGLRRGDVITRFGQAAVTDVTGLRKAVALQKPGSRVGLAIHRNGKNLTKKVTLDALPPMPTQDAMGR